MKRVWKDTIGSCVTGALTIYRAPAFLNLFLILPIPVNIH